jgi:hypothetical protein
LHQLILLFQGPIHEIFEKKKILRNGGIENLNFDFFASFPGKSVTNYMIERLGLNFGVFTGFQQTPY